MTPLNDVRSSRLVAAEEKLRSHNCFGRRLQFSSENERREWRAGERKTNTKNGRVSGKKKNVFAEENESLIRLSVEDARFGLFYLQPIMK